MFEGIFKHKKCEIELKMKLIILNAPRTKNYIISQQIMFMSITLLWDAFTNRDKNVKKVCGS